MEVGWTVTTSLYPRPGFTPSALLFHVSSSADSREVTLTVQLPDGRQFSRTQEQVWLEQSTIVNVKCDLNAFSIKQLQLTGPCNIILMWLLINLELIIRFSFVFFKFYI